MRYCVNESGVNCLRALSNALHNSIENLDLLTSSLSQVSENHHDTLGPHIASIENVISTIRTITADAVKPVEELAAKLNTIADDYLEIIDPASVEGIDLHTSDMKVFWSHHKESWDRYSELASHILQVQSALSSGASNDDIKMDPVLGACVSQYFDPRNMPSVYKGDGFYEFISDGRHRILAARALGIKIPVRIRGIRKRN